MKWLIVGIYLFSILFIHFRGRVRLPFLRQFFDHSSIMAPINLFMYGFSKVPVSTPYIKADQFEGLHLLDENWQMIRDEGLHLQAMSKIKAAENNDDAGFNSFFKNGWKRFYLKWYNANHPSAAEFCPNTVALLNRIPCVKAAMFAELPPEGVLNPHRDPFAGSLRYHLGLVTPNDDRCFIDVDGERYSWRDGEGVVFDETFSQERRRHQSHHPVLRYRTAAALQMGAKHQQVAGQDHDDRRQLAQRNRRPDRPHQQAVPLRLAGRAIPPPLQALEPRCVQGHQIRPDHRGGAADYLPLIIYL